MNIISRTENWSKGTECDKKWLKCVRLKNNDSPDVNDESYSVNSKNLCIIELLIKKEVNIKHTTMNSKMKM